MKTYSSLSLEVIHFKSQDVITASGTPVEPIDYGVCICNTMAGPTCSFYNHSYVNWVNGQEVPYSCTYFGPSHKCGH